MCTECMLCVCLISCKLLYMPDNLIHSPNSKYGRDMMTSPQFILNDVYRLL